eukprot:CAMPEP_0117056706 /NCGR_PEP_ID=MMETSP0472-20121206/39351_1 /TAXON_ID=693140 ORGANISM="Tiarina fusus, Strain LIS" /NCGR_SAMPLE_ID=MMETSP0472 /ASSEMBLY_ACC=CAM_ASM_000603 /LENGTH=417 /DNA_ID=CAMNT_0004773273 /DNA_START=37 /DNA_END=1290 /DNA_ORIENTATION=+
MMSTMSCCSARLFSCLENLPDGCLDHCIGVSITCAFMIPYMWILLSCGALLLRLLLQSIVFWTGLVVVMFGYTVYVIKNRLSANYPTRISRILKVKRVPETPHPKIQQKTYVWLQYEGEEGGAAEDIVSDRIVATGSIQPAAEGDDASSLEPDTATTTPTTSSGTEELSFDEALADVHKSRTELLQVLIDWADVPCVIVATSDDESDGRNGDDWKVDDRITITWIDGDPTKPMYAPHTAKVAGKSLDTMVRTLGWCIVAILVLWFCFGNVIQMDSQALEDDINDGLDRLFSFFGWDEEENGGDGDGDNSDEEDKYCTISTSVDVAYYTLILFQFAVPLIAVTWCVCHKNKLMGFDEPSPDSYQLLQGDDDFADDDNNDDNNGDVEGSSSKVTSAQRGFAISLRIAVQRLDSYGGSSS